MNKSEVVKIVRVRKGGTRDEVKQGAAIEVSGDEFSFSFLGMKPLDIVRMTYGMVACVEQMGFGDALLEMIEYYAKNPVEGTEGCMTVS